MRAAFGLFGLLGLLITMFIVVWMLAGPIGDGGTSYLGQVAKSNKNARQQAQNFSGKDAQGVRANQALTLAPDGDTFTVVALVPAGEIVQRYHFQPGDTLLEIGPQEVGGFIIDSNEQTVRDFLDDAFARTLPITVRNWRGEVVALPDPERAVPPTTPYAPTPTPTPTPNPTPADPPSRTGVPGLPPIPTGM